MKKEIVYKMNILKDNNKYYFFNSLKIEKILQPKNYLFNFDSFGNCWLEDVDGFKLPKKVYDTNKDLKNKIYESFDSYDKNLGVLLSGNKGQGKSLLAKTICIEMGLPIIIINKQIPNDVNFITFLNNIKQNYILFVDEFEKLFKDSKENVDEKSDGYHKQGVFLSFMDGVLMNDHKILFLLTTNNQVNEYFINRPSRVKFLVEYDELPEELFHLITDDKLINKEFKVDLEDNVSLINLNIDLLISIIDDINLFKKPFSEFKDVYNYKSESYKYEVTILKNGVSRFEGILNLKKKIKANETYLWNRTVKNMVKFTKDEIIFESEEWNVDKDDVNILVDLVIKLTPTNSFVSKEYTF